MSDDIVKQLQEWIDGADERQDGAGMWYAGADIMREAIAEIKRLRTALRSESVSPGAISGTKYRPRGASGT